MEVTELNPEVVQAPDAAPADAHQEFNDASYVSPKRVSCASDAEGEDPMVMRCMRSLSAGKAPKTPPLYTNRVDGSVLGFRLDNSREVRCGVPVTVSPLPADCTSGI